MPYHRRNLYVLSVTIFLAALSWNQVMPFLPLFLKELGVKRDLLRWSEMVFAAQAAASIIAMPFWGKMGDSYGRKPMVLRAGVCLAGIYFGMSFCHTPWQLAFYRFLNGALTGFIPGSIILIATNTPQERSANAVATAQAASATGVILGPFVGGWLAQLSGYRGSMRVSGTAVLLCTLLVWRLVREPNKPRSVEKTSLLQDFLLSVRSPILLSIMFTLMIQATFAAAINPVLLLHVKSMAGAVGNSADAWIGIVYCLPAVAFVVSARWWSRFGERSGYERAILIGLVGTTAGAFALQMTESIWMFAALYFATGLFLASISPSTAALICVRVEEGFRGRAYGMQMAAGTLGALVAPLAAGEIGELWGIPGIFMFVGTVFLAGSFGYTLLSRRCRNAVESNHVIPSEELRAEVE